MHVGKCGLVALLCLGAGLSPLLASSAHAQSFAYTGAVQTLNLSQSGTYAITAVGADGGTSPNGAGGLGASVSGSVFLSAGTLLDIVVGGMGRTGNAGFGDGGGGGGGTFLFVPGASQPLLVAGGGGGAGFDSNTIGNGQTKTAGQNGFGTRGGAGGTNGSGGQGGQATELNGGGGAGFLSNGTDGRGGANGNSGGGGLGPLTFAGGAGEPGISPPADGGFGGGGGGGRESGGGGGGYSGGGGGDGTLSNGGGGGGSYSDAGFTNLIYGTNGAGNGSLTLTFVPAAPAVPEPGTVALLASMGVAGAGFVARRRKQAHKAA